MVPTNYLDDLEDMKYDDNQLEEDNDPWIR